MSHPAAQPGPDRSSEAEPDIAVTVIGGYLGSGKTTLVNHLLATGTERVAVLVNDFGDVDIDAALIERHDGDTIALANGCVCCSMVDGLAAALDTIGALEPRPDRLVIEASGVADPASVAAYGHGPGLSLDAVVVLVDAETVRQRAGDKYVGDTVTGQLRAADIVVVNKTDLVDPDVVEAVKGWLRERVDRALLVEASQARVAPAVLFGPAERSDRRPGFGLGGRPIDEPALAPADEVFQTWSWTGDRPIDRSVIDGLMADLPDAVIRAKGILWFDDDPGRPHALQRVGGRWSLRPVRVEAPAAATSGSRLVLIGHRGAIGDRWLSDRLGP